MGEEAAALPFEAHWNDEVAPNDLDARRDRGNGLREAGINCASNESKSLLRLRLLFLALGAFGVSAVTACPLEIGGGKIDVVFDEPAPAFPQKLALVWIETAARAVSSYYGRFPVAHVVVRVRATAGDRIEGGKTFGVHDGGRITVEVGRGTSAAHFQRDWLMTHEMVHLAFPSVSESQHWIEEGISTYVEPIARAQIGALQPEQVWADLVRDLPQGLPEAGDRGLDFTPTYWGGALFCLLADVEIHRRTKNAKGLQDALRGIREAGGTIWEDWELERALRTGDERTGVPVLQELYAKMRAAPAPVDLDDLWRRLGISRRGRTVTIQKDAPLAAVRRAIVPEP